MNINEQLVTRIYRDVVKRDPEASGLAFWTAHLDSGASCEILFHLLYAEKISVTPPAPPPPPQPGVGLDLSDQRSHTVQFVEGQPQPFYFRSAGGDMNLSVAQVAGTDAKTASWSVNGAPWESFTPSGAFRVQPINGPVVAGVTSLQIRVTGILGAGTFVIQALGAVGP